MGEVQETESVELIWITPGAEKLMGYTARVSSPENQDNPEVAKLLGYCIKKRHWSVFELATMCIGIKTSRGISPQILRHRSFSFQEFSQRYAKVEDYIVYPPRRQAEKNRQSSVDDLDQETKDWFMAAQRTMWALASQKYLEAIDRGIAKECARFILPSMAQTSLYMTGSIRSWIHYLQLRTETGVQLEHRRIAQKIQKIFCEQLPILAKALEWDTPKSE